MQHTWECLGLCVCAWVCLESEWYLEVLENSCQQLQFLDCNYAGRVNNCNALLSCLKLRRRYFCIFHAEFCLCAPNWHETHDVWITRSVCVHVGAYVCLWLFLVPLPTHVSDLKTHFVCQFLHYTTMTFSHFTIFLTFPKFSTNYFHILTNNKKGMGSFLLIMSGCQLSAAFTIEQRRTVSINMYLICDDKNIDCNTRA